MRGVLLVLMLLAGPAAAQTASAPQLPLKEGRYSVGGCDRFNEAGGYIGVQMPREGLNKGRQRLVPQAERQDGFCTITRLAPMGAVLSGVAECDNGARTNPSPVGTYRFNYTVHSATSFTSLGKRYEWCPPR